MPDTLSVQAQTLQQLETQINHLIRAYQDLQQGHTVLQHQLQQASQQLEAVLAQLAALEDMA